MRDTVPVQPLTGNDSLSTPSIKMCDKHKPDHWLSNVLVFCGLIVCGYFRGGAWINPAWARRLSANDLHVLFIFGITSVVLGLWLRHW